jgi:hypothetical protein
MIESHRSYGPATEELQILGLNHPHKVRFLCKNSLMAQPDCCFVRCLAQNKDDQSSTITKELCVHKHALHFLGTWNKHQNTLLKQEFF